MKLTSWGVSVDLPVITSPFSASRKDGDGYPKRYEPRLKQLFPKHLKYSFAQRHHDLHQWQNKIQKDTRAGDPALRSCVAIWARGGGKSTTAEMVAADMVVTERRMYIWYVCATQDSADIHLESIKGMLESEEVARANPSASSPKLTKIGTRQSWQRQRIVCANGCMVEAVGLDKGVRGRKNEDQRPDFIILDDIDNEDDSPRTVRKKERALTAKILPSRANNAAVLFVQNLIHADSIATKLTDTSIHGAQYLNDRIVLGPYKAIEGLRTEFSFDEKLQRHIHKIVAGVATWSGQPIEVCQKAITDYGLSSFKRESQHEVNEENENALLTRDALNKTRVSDYPELDTIVVAVDPPASGGRCGICVAGVASDEQGEKHAYILDDFSTEYGASPAEWTNAVAVAYRKYEADYIVAEKNQGGDMVAHTLATHELLKHAKIELVHASRGKKTRAEPVAMLFENDRAHMVGRHSELEDQWVTWVQGDDSPDNLDACVWAVTDLIPFANKRKKVRFW